MIIAGIPINESKPTLICCILIKDLDDIAYDRLFGYSHYNLMLCHN